MRTFAVGKMRGERLEHNGIVIWNDCYNSNPEAAQSHDRRAAAKRRRARRIAVLGEMLELGHAAEELHRQVGRYAAEHGVDLLIGVRGSARDMVDAAVGAGLPESAAHFFEDPAEAGEFRAPVAQPGDAILFKGSRGVQVERALERLLAVRSPMLYFLLYEQLYQYVSPFRVFRYTTFRTAFASLTALFLCIALGPWLINKLRAVSDRPVHPRRRPQVAPEEGRHAHHGRRADHHLDRDPHAAVGGPAISLRVDRDRGAAGLRLDRLPGRLRQGHQAAQPGADRPAQAGLPVRHGLRVRRGRCW